MEEITLGNPNKITENRWVIIPDADIECPDCGHKMRAILGHEWGDVWVCSKCTYRTNWIMNGYELKQFSRRLHNREIQFRYKPEDAD